MIAQETIMQSSASKENTQRKIFIEKLVLSMGARADVLIKAKKLLEFLTQSKAHITTSKKRIPDFDLSPGLEVGAIVTIRDQKAIELLKLLLGAIENKLKKKQISENHFSFGIEEYIEIPGVEYRRDIGILGFNVTVVFARKGLRVKRKKIKMGNLPKKQYVSQIEIIQFMEDRFKTIIA